MECLGHRHHRSLAFHRAVDQGTRGNPLQSRYLGPGSRQQSSAAICQCIEVIHAGMDGPSSSGSAKGFATGRVIRMNSTSRSWTIHCCLTRGENKKGDHLDTPSSCIYNSRKRGMGSSRTSGIHPEPLPQASSQDHCGWHSSSGRSPRPGPRLDTNKGVVCKFGEWTPPRKSIRSYPCRSVECDQAKTHAFQEFLLHETFFNHCEIMIRPNPASCCEYRPLVKNVVQPLIGTCDAGRGRGVMLSHQLVRRSLTPPSHRMVHLFWTSITHCMISTCSQVLYAHHVENSARKLGKEWTTVCE